MYLKIHETQKGRIVAACDKGLLGQILDDGKVHLDLKAHRDFYKGKQAKEDDLKQALARFTSANLVGKKAVAVALEMDLADEESIIYINKVPHIQLYRI